MLTDCWWWCLCSVLVFCVQKRFPHVLYPVVSRLKTVCGEWYAQFDAITYHSMFVVTCWMFDVKLLLITVYIATYRRIDWLIQLFVLNCSQWRRYVVVIQIFTRGWFSATYKDYKRPAGELIYVSVLTVRHRCCVSRFCFFFFFFFDDKHH